MTKPNTPSKLMQLLAACVLALTSTWVQADDVTNYQVEIILFKNTGSGAVTSETWPQNPGAPDLSHTVTLIPEKGVAASNPVPAGASPSRTTPPASTAVTSADVPTAYQLLPTKDLKLNGVEASLRRSAVRVPILHVGWRQPIVTKDQAVPIHIYGGTEYTVAPDSSATAVPNQDNTVSNADPPGVTEQSNPATAGQPSAANGTPGAGAGTQASPVWEINGTILLSRARYLHVWTDLVFSEPANQVPGADPASSGINLAQFRMRQHRRMRSGELHYLDHPMFGMLIMVTPYTGPLPPAPSPATAAPTPTSATTPTPTATSPSPAAGTSTSPPSPAAPGPDQPTPAVTTPLPADDAPNGQ